MKTHIIFLLMVEKCALQNLLFPFLKPLNLKDFAICSN